MKNKIFNYEIVISVIDTTELALKKFVFYIYNLDPSKKSFHHLWLIIQQTVHTNTQKTLFWNDFLVLTIFYDYWDLWDFYQYPYKNSFDKTFLSFFGLPHMFSDLQLLFQQVLLFDMNINTVFSS